MAISETNRPTLNCEANFKKEIRKMKLHHIHLLSF